MKEDSAVLYEELLRGLDKVKAKAKNEGEKKLMKSEKKQKINDEKLLVDVDDVNLKDDLKEVYIDNNDFKGASIDQQQAIDVDNKVNFKTPIMNQKDTYFKGKEKSEPRLKKQEKVVEEKNFWEKLYIYGASFLFAIGCFMVSLFVMMFSFLFYRHMMKIANDAIRLEAFLNDIWMVFSGGAIFLFIYLFGFFIKNSYKNKINKDT